MGIFDEQSNVFSRYAVRLEFRDRIMGGVPKDPKVIQGWLKARAGIEEERELAQMAARTLTENGADLPVTGSQIAEMDAAEIYDLMDSVSDEYAASKNTNGFKMDDEGLYLEDRQVKAMLKESTNILFAGERWGRTKKGPKSFVAERVFIRPQRLHLDRDEPDGVELVVGHVSDAGGKRSTLTYHEYAERPALEFEVEVVRDELTQDQWMDLWTHAQENGLGALRSQSYGKFDIEKWQKL